ncbi:MAG: aminotransferase class III-fold pyridoxal phosphate-dependent enzyme [Alphaproteobacteria bacterium]
MRPTGLQQRLGVYPDMTTLGKYVGGGSSFGAFGGRRDIMAQFDPASPSALPHSGTFNNNVMSMAAGYAGLSRVFTEDAANELYDRGEDFKARLNEIARARGVGVQVTGSGSILGIHTLSHPIRVPHDSEDPVPDRLPLIHLEMMLRGFVYAQRGIMTLSLAMTDDDLKRFIDAFDEVLGLHSALLRG